MRPFSSLLEVPLRPLILGVAAGTVFFCLAACATTPASQASASRDSISRAEIQSTPAATAHDLVTRLRPHWLRSGGAGNIRGGPQMQVTLVYMDGVRMGTLAALRNISTSGITSMRWLNAGRAQMTFPDAAREPIAGAIAISTSQ